MQKRCSVHRQCPCPVPAHRATKQPCHDWQAQEMEMRRGKNSVSLSMLFGEWTELPETIKVSPETPPDSEASIRLFRCVTMLKEYPDSSQGLFAFHYVSVILHTTAGALSREGQTNCMTSPPLSWQPHGNERSCLKRLCQWAALRKK